MENPFKVEGFKQFFVRTVIFIGIGLAIALFIMLFFRHTTFYDNYLSIPSIFQLDKHRTTFLNSCLFGLIAFLILSRKKLLQLKKFKLRFYQIFLFLLSIIFLIIQYSYSYLINQNLEFFLQNAIIWAIIKLLINVFFIISLALSVYGLDFTKYFIKNYKKEILFFSMIILGFFLLTLLFQNLWMIFSSLISQLLFKVFKLFFNDVHYSAFVTSSTMSEGGGPLLSLGNFSAIIGKPCSGIDSLLLFITLYLLVVFLDYKRLNKSLTIIFFIVGAFGMFAVNILRIFLLFIVGAFYSEKLAIGLFHTNIGWILFVAYFSIYCIIVSRYIYNKKSN